MSETPKPSGPEAPQSLDHDPEPAVVDARQLFQGQREIHIDHQGIRYRLRITRRNKLILQK